MTNILFLIRKPKVCCKSINDNQDRVIHFKIIKSYSATEYEETFSELNDSQLHQWPSKNNRIGIIKKSNYWSLWKTLYV